MDYSKLLTYREGVIHPLTDDTKKKLKKNIVSFYCLADEQIKFLNFSRLIKKKTRILMDPFEISQLAMLVRNTDKLKGDIVEVGVYQGGSARVICEYKKKRHLHLIDTFEGLPKTDRSDKNNFINRRYEQGQYPSDMKKVKRLLMKFDNVYIHKGLFPLDSFGLEKNKFSLVHLDLDIFKSTFDCLNYFYPKMNKGGIIITHDYQSASGVRKAFDQFFKDKPEVIIELAVTQALVVIL